MRVLLYMAWRHTPFLLIALFFASRVVVVVSSKASDSEVLLKFKASLENNEALFNWNGSTSPCSWHTANWVGVRCRLGHVWGLKLENMGLRGVIDVDLLRLLSYLRTISFMKNNFEGPWPDLRKIGGLKAVYLSNNNFSGEIRSDAFVGMKRLKKVHLAHNQFNGSIPLSLMSLRRLLELRLENNKFEGKIPAFQQKLRSFNLSNNDLKGSIPLSLSKMDSSSFSGNHGLCGNPLGKCKKTPVLGILIVLIVVVVIIVVIAAIAFVVNWRRRPSLSLEAPRRLNLHKKSGIKESDKAMQGSPSTSVGSKAEDMNLSFVGNDGESFDMQDLLKASAEILSSGYFGSSYKANLCGRVMVVKRFRKMNNVTKEEFQEHMRRLGNLRHSNVLPLVAYYYRKEDKLLISDFIPNGSLAVHLHVHKALEQPSLDWPTRLKIVKGIARGLKHIYSQLPGLITPHGNLKSSNVLLDESLKPLVTDYGLIPLINHEYAREIMVAYKSPEYAQHGRITKKTDVWSFGIMILEILTGKFPASFLQHGKRKDKDAALTWVRSVVPEGWTDEVFDKDMGATKNNEEDMRRLLKIGLACCEGEVEKRWDLNTALQRIEELKDNDDDDDFYITYASEVDANSRRFSHELT